MKYAREIQILFKVCTILFRIWCGAILCCFAFVPAWILFYAIYNLATDRTAPILPMFAVILATGFLTYLLLLLAFRAFTGRGRKKDGGLLPPWAMKGMFHGIGIVGLIALYFGLHGHRIEVMLPGLMYVLIALIQLADYRKAKNTSKEL